MAAAAAGPVCAATVGQRARPVPGHGQILLGSSRAMADSRRQVDRAAAAPFAVLVEGESGSGKELVARALHRAGPRRDRPFCTLNCAALPDDLVEAELFGHARGAFTGAVAERPGVFEEAHGGHAVPRRDRRAARRGRRPRCCARFRKASSAASARTSRAGSTCAWSRRPTAICGRKSPPGGSGSICSTGSTSSASRCRRCASAARTLRSSPSTSGARRLRASAAARRSSTATRGGAGALRLARQRARTAERAGVAGRAQPAAGRGAAERRCRPQFGASRCTEPGGSRRRGAPSRNASCGRARQNRRTARARRRGARRHAAGADQADGAAGNQDEETPLTIEDERRSRTPHTIQSTHD